MSVFFSDFNPIASDRDYVEDFKKLNYKKRVLISVLTALGALASLPLFGILGVFTFRRLTKKLIAEKAEQKLTLVKTKRVFINKIVHPSPHALLSPSDIEKEDSQKIENPHPLLDLNKIYPSQKLLNYHNFLVDIAKNLNISPLFFKERLDHYIKLSHPEIYNAFLEIVADLSAYENFLGFLQQQLASLANEECSDHTFSFANLKQFHEVLFFMVNDLINDKKLLNQPRTQLTVLFFNTSYKDCSYSSPDILLREDYEESENFQKTLKIYHGYGYLENNPMQAFYLPPIIIR